MSTQVSGKPMGSVTAASPVSAATVVGTLSDGRVRRFAVGGPNGLARVGADGRELADRLTDLEASQSGGMLSFTTKALMDADLAHADGTLALVTNDATVNNNRTYRKNGASGAGTWVASVDRIAAVQTQLATPGATDGAAMVGYLPAGSGAAPRDAQAKMREHYSLQDAGAVSDGVTDDQAAVAVAIGNSRQVRLVGDTYVSAFSNPLGTELVGPGRVFVPIGGGLKRQLSSQCDNGQHIFGQEYLSHFHNLILNKQDPATIRMSGDSTTNGDGATSPFRPWEILQMLGLGRGHEITTTNAGHSGNHTGQWVSTHVTGDLAANPDLYIVRWGINDPFAGRSITDFATSLRAGLAQCRASKTLSQMSIVLMSPNSTSDTPNGRDEAWYEQARMVCRQAARDYQCCFIDTYALWRDSRPAAGVYMDNPFGDGRAIHPLNVMNAWIYSKVADVLFPEGLRPRLIPSSLGTLLAAALPNRFPRGYSIYSSGVGASDFGVTNATVLTWRSADGGVYQRANSNFYNGANNGNYPVSQTMERYGLGGTWFLPHTEPSIQLTSLLVNGWVDFAANNVPRAKKTNNTVTLSGLIKSGTITNGTQLFTLPVGYRPWQSVEVFLCPTGPTGTTTPCVLHITAAGVCTIQGGANAAFISLSGISFEVGG